MPWLDWSLWTKITLGHILPNTVWICVCDFTFFAPVPLCLNVYIFLNLTHPLECLQVPQRGRVPLFENHWSVRHPGSVVLNYLWDVWPNLSCDHKCRRRHRGSFLLRLWSAALGVIQLLSGSLQSGPHRVCIVSAQFQNARLKVNCDHCGEKTEPWCITSLLVKRQEYPSATATQRPELTMESRYACITDRQLKHSA